MFSLTFHHMPAGGSAAPPPHPPPPPPPSGWNRKGRGEKEPDLPAEEEEDATSHCLR